MRRAAARGGLLALLFFAPLLARAADASLSLPPPAPVVDEYRLLAEADAAALDRLLRQVKSRSGVEIAVFIPGSLRGLEIEDFSIRVAEAWKLGRKKEDKGLLLTIAPRERKMRIEVGYGLEGELTDAFTRRVQDGGMRPFFKQGRYYEGILNGLSLLQEKIPLGLQRDEVGVDGGSAIGPGLKLFLFLLLVLYLLSRISRLGRGGYYYGGGWGGGGSWGGSSSSGGGSWGGGGGSFGGGGSSSSW